MPEGLVRGCEPWAQPLVASSNIGTPAPTGSAGGRDSGVKALMLAILEDAIRVYLGPVPQRQKEAAQWIADARAHWVFSFSVVCETLGLDPGAMRAAVYLHAHSPRAQSSLGRNPKAGAGWLNRRCGSATASELW